LEIGYFGHGREQEDTKRRRFGVSETVRLHNPTANFIEEMREVVIHATASGLESFGLTIAEGCQ
jgi:hypothetical protein